MEEMRHPEEETLDSKSWCWSSVPAKGKPPCQRSLHTGVMHDDSFYIFGGYDGIQRTNDFYRFNFTNMKWTMVTSLNPPTPRDRHTAVSYERCIYIYGGYDGSSRVNDFYEYNVDTNTWREMVPSTISTTPSARHSHAAVVYQDSMYIFGGYDGLYRNDFHRYNFKTNTWNIMTDSLGANEFWPKPRYRTTATVLGDNMFIFGGHDGSRQLNDFYAWSFKNETWTEVQFFGSPPSPRDSHVAVAYKSSLFIFGGSTGNPRSDFYEYKLDEQRWVSVVGASGTAPSSRFCHVGAVYNRCFYVFGGYDGTQRLNDFSRFRLEPESFGIPDSSLLLELKGLVNNELFSDVCFIVEGRRVNAHRLFLSRSSYFLAMLTGAMMESRSKEIVLTNVSYSTFLTILKYLYTDIAEVTLDSAMELFIAADHFCIERLKKICEQMILTSINLTNAPSVFQAADMHGALALREASLRYILANFDYVSKTAGFESMARANIELVLEILLKR